MKILKWVFLVLYVLLIIGLFGLVYSLDSSSLPSWLGVFYGLNGKLFWIVLIIVVTMISQVLFVFGTGKIDLQRPGNKYLMLVPVCVGALAFSLLVYGIILSSSEFFNIGMTVFNSYVVNYGIIALLWVIWGIVFYTQMRSYNRYDTYKTIITGVMAGSLLEFIPAMIMHYVVTIKRPGCFAGMYTGIGVSIGLVLMLWSFGPGIIFLFIREKYKAELREKRKTESK